MQGRGPRQARAAGFAILATASIAACLDAPGSPESAGGPDAGEGPEKAQLLVNPSFEDGVDGWTLGGSVELLTTDEASLPPSGAGSRFAVLGRVDDDYDSIDQVVTVPAWAQVIEVSGVRCFTSDELTDDAYDELWIYIESPDGSDGEDVLEASNLDASGDTCTWTSFRHTATAAYAGEQLMFGVEVSMDEDLATSFAVDDLAVTAYP